VTTEDQRHSECTPRKPLAWILAAVFVLSMVMGTGPGVLLINRPDAVFGVPLVYAWGIFWYLVQAAVALIAYLALWRNAANDNGHSLPESAEGDRR
jgi:hypothetical protein